MDLGDGTKRLAWAGVALVGGAFCYSVGFQSGWSQAASNADARFDGMARSLHEVVARAETYGQAVERPTPSGHEGRHR